MRPLVRARLVLALAALSWVGCGLTVVGSGPSADDLADGGTAESGAPPPGSMDGAASADADGAPPILDGSEVHLEEDGSACGSNLVTDSSNCGACGHNCQGALCVNSLCTPAVAVTFTHDVRAISGNGTRLYFTSTSSKLIAWVPLANVTATPVNVLTNVDDPRQVTVDDANLYWVMGGTSQLFRATLDGQNNFVIVNSVNGCVWLGPGGNGYGADYDGNDVRRFSIADPNTNAVFLTAADGVAKPWGVAATATDILWTNSENNGGVFRRALGGGMKTTIATNQGNPNCIALDNGFVYWANHNSGEIHRARPDGTNNRVIAGGQVTPTSFAFDGPWIYWNSGNSIMKVAR